MRGLETIYISLVLFASIGLNKKKTTGYASVPVTCVLYHMESLSSKLYVISLSVFFLFNLNTELN